MSSAHQEALAAGVPAERENRLSVILTSNDLDRVWAALILAVGAASSGLEVSMFFAFWGLSVLRREGAANGHPRHTLLERMFGIMLPKGPHYLKLSKMNLAGIGPALFRHVARVKNIACPDELLRTAQELGVKLIACEMSMGMMGLKREELIDGVQYGGVATCLGDACKSKATLFV
jgi:peroxiredoxin family protein